MKSHLSESFQKKKICIELISKETQCLEKSWHKAYVQETAFWGEFGYKKYYV